MLVACSGVSHGAPCAPSGLVNSALAKLRWEVEVFAAERVKKEWGSYSREGEALEDLAGLPALLGELFLMSHAC